MPDDENQPTTARSAGGRPRVPGRVDAGLSLCEDSVAAGQRVAIDLFPLKKDRTKGNLSELVRELLLLAGWMHDAGRLRGELEARRQAESEGGEATEEAAA